MSGKLSIDLLEKYVFNRIGIRDPKVLVGPMYGEDAAIIDLDDKVLIVHVDPITAAEDLIGWLAVHIASNDIAVRGAKPRWLLPVLYLPVDSSENLLDKITAQIDKAAKEIHAMIVGGHSEYTPGIERPLISMTAIGIAPKNRYVVTSGAKPGDIVLMTKYAGLEGTAIIATDFKDILLSKGIPKNLIDRASKFIEMISVIKEALALAEAKLANSMHDPTEGGILGGVAEIAYASNVKIEIWEESIPISNETEIICQALNLDPLKLISSGVLLATIPKDRVEEALNTIKSIGIPCAVIGKVGEGIGVIIKRRDGKVEKIPRHVPDEIYRLWNSHQ
ncbi:MAG TPA: hydrogenase assembly protein HupF [Ignisphaera sp.]|nr:hydrogenase assembly protein HupF [Ignisphaera sp.]